jgi:uncharacterized protein (DUF924 family)
MHTDALHTLEFWFGPPDSPDHRAPRPIWFQKSEAFDTEVRTRFGGLIDAALAGEHDGWLTRPVQPLPALALVIVLDQFNRNAFRGTARAFAGEPGALRAARALVASGADRALTGVQRQFAYLPFEHAEDLAHQRTSVQLFRQLGRDEPALADLERWAQRHLDIIARFGRFPHRNAALGRTSTDEELAFLQEPGSGF